MSTGQGIAARCAIGDESSYQSAVAVDELIPFTGESINRAILQLEAQFLDGNAGRKGLRNSIVSVEGALDGELVYDEETGDPIGVERILRGVLGASARDAGNGLNQYKTNDTVDDLWTICFNKQVSNWEIVSAKFNNLTISGAVGEKIMFSTDIIGYDLLRTDDAGITNAIAAVTGLSPAELTNVHFDDLIFRIANLDNAIASGDQYKINSFEFGIENVLTDPQHSTVASGHTDNALALEPKRNGQRVVKLSITLPRYESDQFFSWLNAGTALQADLKFATGSYEFNILLPVLYVAGDAAANIGGAELVEPTINFIPIRNNSTNTDMTFQDSDVITDEVGIECKSGRSSQA